MFWMKRMREEVLELLKKDAYKKGEYTLASGRKSEHYVNCTPVTLTARGLTLVSLMFLEFFFSTVCVLSVIWLIPPRKIY